MIGKAMTWALATALAVSVSSGVSRADFSKFAGNVEDEQEAQKKRKEEGSKAPQPKPKAQSSSATKNRADTFSITMTKPPPKAREFPKGSAEADYAAIYRAYLARNEAAVNVDAVAVDFYEAFGIPAGKIGGSKQSSDCSAYSKRWSAAKSDTALRTELVEEARVFFQRERRNAKDAPKTVKVRMRTKGVLGQYDRTAKAFPVEVEPFSATIRAPKSICQVKDHATNGRKLVPQGRFEAAIQGGNADRITMLPMPKAEADAYLRSHPKRDVDIIVSAKVGPIEVRGGKIQPAPVRLMGAKAIDSKTGRTLAAYEKDAFAGGQ